MKAVWKGQVIAESDKTEVVDGNHYFPSDSIKSDFYKPSDTKTSCSFKGEASYFTLDVNGEQNPDAAWSYQTPKDRVKKIEGHVAFWKGVEVIE